MIQEISFELNEGFIHHIISHPQLGVRYLVASERQAWLINPARDLKLIIPIPHPSYIISGMLWDISDKNKNVFIIWNDKDGIIFTFVHVLKTLTHPQGEIILAGKTQFSDGVFGKGCLVHDGYLTFLVS